MIYKVPGKDFVTLPIPVDEKIGIEFRGAEGLGPIPMAFVG
jgi:hypothetical protein